MGDKSIAQVLQDWVKKGRKNLLSPQKKGGIMLERIGTEWKSRFIGSGNSRCYRGRRGIAILGVSCLLFAYCLLPTSTFAADKTAKPEDEVNVLKQKNARSEEKIARLEQVLSQLMGTLDKGTRSGKNEKGWISGTLEPSGTATETDVVKGKTFRSSELSWIQNTGERTDTLAGGATDSGQIIVTGQTTCYNSTGDVIGCSDAGSWPGQDGWYQEGLAFSFTDSGNIVTIDNNTGLMWAKYGNGAGCYNGEKRTWEQALVWAKGLNFAGHSDWRLPNIRELQSIADYGKYNPAIDGTYFPNTQSNFYWSSTTYHGFPSLAWYVYFGYGPVNLNDKTTYYYVRAVRSSQ